MLVTYFSKLTNCLFIRFIVRAFRKLLSIYVFSYFPFGFEDRMWDLIVSVSDHCLSFYFGQIGKYFPIYFRKTLVTVDCH